MTDDHGDHLHEARRDKALDRISELEARVEELGAEKDLIDRARQLAVLQGNALWHENKRLRKENEWLRKEIALLRAENMESKQMLKAFETLDGREK